MVRGIGWLFEHRRSVVVGWLALVLSLFGVSQLVGTRYQFSTDMPGLESTRAAEILAESFPQAKGDTLTVVWRAPDGATVTDPAVAAEVTGLLDRIAGMPHVASVVSPYDPVAPAAGHVSPDGRTGFATVTLDGSSIEVPASAILGVVDVATVNADGADDAVRVAVTGRAVTQADPPHMGAAELIGIAAAGVILLLAFGSLLSMLLPLATAGIALAAAMASVALLTRVVAIPNFAPQLTALISLGVGIDYALFVVSRHRTNLKQGIPVETSVIRAFNTAGRAVIFAGITVMISLLGLFVTRVGFLYGLAIAASIGVAWTMLVTMTLLPALLGFIGPRVLSRKERDRLAEHGPEPEVPSGAWMRWATLVQRRPLPFIAAALVVLGLLTLPALSLRMGSADQGNDPAGSTTRVAYDMLAEGFGPGVNGPLVVVVETPGGSADQPALQRFAERLRATPGVAGVIAPVPSADGRAALVTVYPTTSPQAAETSDLIVELRERVIPDTGLVGAHVGGATAVMDDFAGALRATLPWFLLGVIVLSSLLLLLAFRSLAIPVKAAVMNLLAAAATFGVLTAVFQRGWGLSVIGVDRTGPVDAFLPIMLLAILFGLSMDYQVFLVSRMHEEWVLTGDNRTAVTRGLAETGRVITAAALIMVAVFTSFVFGDDRIIKMFGLGLAVAIGLDAFVIRSLLVPALMQVLGRWNWWIPAWLDRVLPRLTIEPRDFGHEDDLEADRVLVGGEGPVASR